MTFRLQHWKNIPKLIGLLESWKPFVKESPHLQLRAVFSSWGARRYRHCNYRAIWMVCSRVIAECTFWVRRFSMTVCVFQRLPFPSRHAEPTSCALHYNVMGAVYTWLGKKDPQFFACVHFLSLKDIHSGHMYRLESVGLKVRDVCPWTKLRFSLNRLSKIADI